MQMTGMMMMMMMKSVLRTSRLRMRGRGGSLRVIGMIGAGDWLFALPRGA